MKEEWLDIPEYRGFYQASSLGRVRSVTRKVTTYFGTRTVRSKILSPRIVRGRYMVILSMKGKVSNVYVHTLVLLAFVGPRPENMEARHYPERNPFNNRITNLSWSTEKVNQRDRVEHDTHCRGERCTEAKLTESDVKWIRMIWGTMPSTERKRKGLTVDKVAQKFGVCGNTIRNVLRSVTWAWLE